MHDFARFRRGTVSDAEPYAHLVRSFVSRAIDAPTFASDFMLTWGRQRYFLPYGLFPVLEQVFYAIQDYVEEDHLRDPGELDADQFRARVTELEPELIARFEDARRREPEP